MISELAREACLPILDPDTTHNPNVVASTRSRVGANISAWRRGLREELRVICNIFYPYSLELSRASPRHTDLKMFALKARNLESAPNDSRFEISPSMTYGVLKATPDLRIRGLIEVANVHQ